MLNINRKSFLQLIPTYKRIIYIIINYYFEVTIYLLFTQLYIAVWGSIKYWREECRICNYLHIIAILGIVIHNYGSHKML